MNIKQKLISLKNKLLKIKNEDTFFIDVENHEPMDTSIYRFHYIDYYNIGELYGYNSKGLTDWPYKPFVLPKGMSYKDAFKVLSYLTDFIERELKLEECSFNSVRILDSLIDIERFGFKRININSDDKVNELFTINGIIKRFMKSEYYSKYIEWYTPNVTKKEVDDIYQKCGLEFYDLVFQYDRDESTYFKTKSLSK